MTTRSFLKCLAGCLILFCYSCKKNKSGRPEENSSLKLEYMEVQEPQTAVSSAELFLHGQFGAWNSSSSVRIGTNIFTGSPDPVNSNATILLWTPTLIRLRIPKADDPGGSGIVQVTAGGKESNPRILNVWDGFLIYDYPSGGNILERCDINFILRADCKPYTNVPINSLIKPVSTFAKGSSVQWHIEGTATSLYDGCRTMTVSWEAVSGGIGWYSPSADNVNLSENFQSEVSYSGTENWFRLSALKIHKFNAGKSTITFGGCSPGEPQQQDVHLTEMPSDLANLIVMNIDGASSAIKPGRVTLGQQPNHAGLFYEGTPPSLIAEVSWNLTPAKYINQ
jgi:hypothetical protein